MGRWKRRIAVLLWVEPGCKGGEDRRKASGIRMEKSQEYVFLAAYLLLSLSCRMHLPTGPIISVDFVSRPASSSLLHL